MNLPGCMMPDGADPCPEYQQLAAENAALKARLAEAEATNRHRDRQIAAIVTWLERNQPDVFRRGLWDAIGECTRDSAASQPPPVITFPDDMSTAERIGDPRIDGQPSPVAFCGPFPECSDDELMLREMLAISYSSAHGGMLYGDDGELQFGGYPHPIDFRRDSVAEIRRKIDARGMAKLIEQQRATDNGDVSRG